MLLRLINCRFIIIIIIIIITMIQACTIWIGYRFGKPALNRILF